MNAIQMILMVTGSGGGLGLTFHIVGRTYATSVTDPSTANATTTFGSNGDLTAVAGSGTPDANEWIEGNPSAGLGDVVDIRFTRNSGNASFTHPSSVAVGVWVQTNVNRLFGMQQASQGVDIIRGFFEVRPTGGGSTIFTSDEVIYDVAVVA